MFTLACTRQGFVKQFCGTLVVAFVTHNLFDRQLPTDERTVERLHQQLRQEFAIPQYNPIKPQLFAIVIGLQYSICLVQ